MEKYTVNVNRWVNVLTSTSNSGLAGVTQNFTTNGGPIRVLYDHDDFAPNTTTVTYGTTQSTGYVTGNGAWNFPGGPTSGTATVGPIQILDNWSIRIQEQQMVPVTRRRWVW